MSVIVGRALPDARDGLKPVHRRILYAMNELGLSPDRPYRKCARVVGEVLGKYHPHGDTAVYDALVRMAQDFSMRSPLIDGHGNFGSVDDDPPAAMRYTECRLRSLTTDALLQDIESETVDFIATFDGSEQEPVVMPARVPQLLLNGSSGIAVGMATNIPPHNLGEIIDGVVALIHNPDLTNAELMRIIPGPDFPTGAQVLGTSGIREAYTTGRGSIVMRGVANIETIEHRGRPDREAIIVTELPYQTNKAALIEKIAELVNDRKLDGISDIRDESDRDGMRIVIELKRDAYPRVVLNNLYKQTPIQSNFGANMLALVNGEPQLLTLRHFLEVFLEFRIETLTRRTRYQLRKAEERDHLLQGLLIALDNLDAIIHLIRHAADTVTAKQELITSYQLSEVQADAILQMQLRRLTALEAEKIHQEHEELQRRIADLQDILARRERILEMIETELGEIRQKHTTPRRTQIEQAEGEIGDADLIANEKAVILLTEQGYIKRMPVNAFDAQNRATRGKAGTRMKEDDAATSSRTSRGTPIVQLLPIPRDEKITSIIPVTEFSRDEYLVMLTCNGYIKKTELAAFSNIRTNGLIAISLEEGDQLRWVRRARAEDTILIGSALGKSIHFRTNHEQLRPLGRATRGVRSMKLRQGDLLVGMDILPGQVVATLVAALESDASLEEETELVEEGVEIVAARESDASMAAETALVQEGMEEAVEYPPQAGPWVLIVTTSGFGKRVPVAQFRLQNRAGMGIVATKFRKPGDHLAALRIVNEGDELMMITNRGIIIRQSVNAISCQSRPATGVRLQRLDEDDAILAVALVPHSDETEESLENGEDEGAIADSPDTGESLSEVPDATDDQTPDSPDSVTEE